jgi:SAM-dependent MidA family methyltransferase
MLLEVPSSFSLLLSAQIRDAVARTGSISFSEFMQAALYHPTLGYYTRENSAPFGAAGDYFTATQLQPVFGRLIAQLVRQLGCDRFFDWGSGAESMRPFFDRYTAIDVTRGDWPAAFTGFVFANELFDALPVDVFVRRGGAWRERRVAWDTDRFVWKECGAPSDEQRDWLDRFGPLEEDSVAEVSLASKEMLAALSCRMRAGWLLVVDYGITRRELIRFSEGTLMSYRRHAASSDVLDSPGDRDITSHVNFDALRSAAKECRFREDSFLTLSSLLLRAGESDAFASALDAPEPMSAGLRMQLKTLLYGMGETFRAVLWEREEEN